MKKLVLFVAALFMAAGAMAQKVTGCYVYSFGINPDGNTIYGALYREKSMLKYFSPSSSSEYVIYPAGMVPYNDNFAMAYNRFQKDDNRTKHDMYVKDQSENTIMDLEADAMTYQVVDLDNHNGTIYSIATAYSQSPYNANIGLLMIDDVPTRLFIAGETSGGSTTYRNTSAEAIKVCPDGSIYVGLYAYRHKGGENFADGWWGRIEKLIPNGSSYTSTAYVLPESYSIINSFDIYDGYLFICGNIYDPSTDTRKAMLWRLAGGVITSQELDSAPSNAIDVKIDGGFCYVTGWAGSNIKVWRSALDEGITETATYITHSTPSGKFNSQALDVNSTGVYYGGYVGGSSSFPQETGAGKVWKDGEELYDFSDLNGNKCSSVKAIVAKEYRDTPTVHQLPYTENFEMGNTDWRNWRIDDDGNNGNVASYWDRYYKGGKTCVSHRYHYDMEQDDDLYSPMIQIPSDTDKRVILKFDSNIYGGLDYFLNNGTAEVYAAKPSNQSNFFGTTFQFTLLADLKDLHESGDHTIVNNQWSTYEIELPASLRGEVISLNFYYVGENAHNWAITNISVHSEYDGVEEEGESVALSVMPNPANDIIRVSGLNGMEEVNIYNTLGQVVKSAHLNDGESLNISDLSAGVYMLRSENSEQVVKFTVK